jgi:osmotically-inducible protein OsmY
MSSCRFAAALFVVSGMLLVAACGNSDQERALAQETKKPLGIGSAKKANAELEEAVRAKLEGDARLKGIPIKVNADVTRNQVTLSGTVPSQALRDRAVQLAKSAQAGVIVNDQLRLEPKGSNPSSSARNRGYA